MPKWSQLIKEASEAEDFGERWSPPQDWEGTVKVIAANGKEVKGLPRFGLHLEIQSGEFQGKKFWTNLIFTNHAGVNKRVLKHLAALGISEEFLNDEPDVKVVAAALPGRVVRMKAGYRKDNNNPDRVYDNHTFTGVETPAAKAEVTIEVEDDDDDWEDED